MLTFTAIIFTLQAIVKRVVAYKIQRMEKEKNTTPLHISESGVFL
jgi:hypothetical protein